MEGRAGSAERALCFSILIVPTCRRAPAFDPREIARKDRVEKREEMSRRDDNIVTRAS